jgi:hypothetical protein
MAEIKGLSKVLRNLNVQMAALGIKTKAGLMEAGLFVKSKAVPITPIDTGNLRGSAYVELSTKGAEPVAIIGYASNYAIYVHEGVEKHFNVGQAKFLETALKENTSKILEILRKNAKL